MIAYTNINIILFEFVVGATVYLTTFISGIREKCLFLCAKFAYDVRH
jgi:hypothetical protein